MLNFLMLNSILRTICRTILSWTLLLVVPVYGYVLSPSSHTSWDFCPRQYLLVG